MIVINLSVNQVNIDEALQQAEKKTANAAKKMQKDLNNIKGGQGLKNSLGEVSTALQSTGVNLHGLDKLGGIFTGALGPIGALVAALSALGKIAVGVFDQMTQSVEQWTKKKELALKDNKQKTTNQMSKQQNDNGYLERLKQLSNAEMLGNAGKRQAAELINILAGRYEDLGISIDAVTGKIQGLQAAQAKMLRQQQQMNIKNLKTEHRDAAELSDKKSLNAFREFDKVFGTGWVDDLAFSMTGGVTKVVGNAYQNYKGMNTEQQLEYLQNVRSHAKTDDQIKAIQQAIELKKQQLKIERELAELRKTGVISEQEYARRLKQSTEKGKVTKAERGATKYEQERERVEAETRKQRESADFAALQTTGEQIDYLQKKRDQQATIQHNLQGAKTDIQSKKYDDERERLENLREIGDLEERIARLKQNPQANKGLIASAEQDLARLQGKTFRHDADRAQDRQAVARIELDIARSKQEQQRIEIQIQKLQKKSEDYYKNLKQNLDGELSVQTLILQGKYQQAERQKIINDLKAKGLKVDEAEVDAIMQRKKALAGLKQKQTIKESAQATLDSVNPNKKQAEYNRRKREIQKSTGHEMSAEDSASLKQLVELETKLKSIEKPDFKDMNIISNDLTRRGGFSTGAYVPQSDRIQHEIRNYAKQQNDITREIKQLVKKLEEY